MSTSNGGARSRSLGMQDFGRLHTDMRELKDRTYDFITGAIKSTLRSRGLELRRIPFQLQHGHSEVAQASSTPDFDEDAARIIQDSNGLTMTSPERLFSLIEAVRYVERAGIQGDVVECGVWLGGSMKAAATTLISLGKTQRTLWLYDTYEGLPEATEHDVDFSGYSQADIWRPGMARAPLYRVQETMRSTGYPEDNLQYVVGKVEETIPQNTPKSIAILRLDTDYYSSTKHELQHLVPLVSKGGVVIIDDYGHFKGARLAVDEYLSEQRLHVFLSRVDYSARLFLM